MITDGPVGGIRSGAAGIADARANDTWKLPEPGIRSPESTEGERRCLGEGWRLKIDRGDNPDGVGIRTCMIHRMLLGRYPPLSKARAEFRAPES